MLEQVEASDIVDGDVLVIQGTNANNEPEKWYAEKVGIDGNGLLEVYVLEPDVHDPLILRFSIIMYTVPVESIMEHASASIGTRKAWASVGVRMLERGTTFVMKSDEELLVGDYAEDISSESSQQEDDSEEDDNSSNSLDDFIVSEDDPTLLM